MKQKTNKTIKIFSWAAFLNDFGAEMIYPIWPVFVTGVLGAPMWALGFMDGLGEAIVSLSQAGSGYLSDRIRKRKIFIWLGYIFGFLSRIGYAFSGVWQYLIPFRILDGAGKIRGAPRDAILSDLSTQGNRGRNFGFLRTMDNLGAMFGVLFSIFLLGILGYRNLFLIAAIPSFLGALLIVFFIKEKNVGSKKVYQGLHLERLSQNFRLFLWLSTVFALGSFSYSFLLIFAKNLHFPTVSLPVFYLIFVTVTSASSLPFGILCDKVGYKSVIKLSFFLWALVCLTLIFSDSHMYATGAFVLYGLHKGSLDTAQKAFVAELAPENHKASTLGGFQMVIGLAALPASLAAGFLWDFISPTAPFYLSLGLTTLSIVMLSFVSENKLKVQEKVLSG